MLGPPRWSGSGFWRRNTVKGATCRRLRSWPWPGGVREGGGRPNGHAPVTAGHRGRRPRVPAGSAPGRRRVGGQSAAANRSPTTARPCGRAVLDNVGSTATQMGRTVRPQHCQGGQPRGARRGETTSGVRQSTRPAARRQPPCGGERVDRGECLGKIGASKPRRPHRSRGCVARRGLRAYGNGRDVKGGGGPQGLKARAGGWSSDQGQATSDGRAGERP
jgi:hypothetical protein